MRRRFPQTPDVSADPHAVRFADLGLSHWLVLGGVCLFVLIRVTSCVEQSDNNRRLPPIDELAFAKVVEDGYREWRDATNSVQKGYALKRRDDLLCASFKSTLFQDWVGTIDRVEATGANGSLILELSPHLHLKTNRIGPDSPIYSYLLYAARGQLVRMSGLFRRYTFSGSCFSEDGFQHPAPSYEIELKSIEYVHPS